MRNKYLIGILLHTTLISWSSGIQISAGSVYKKGDVVFIDFDIAWDLSWNTEINHDAAWVFGKNPKDNFKHVRLKPGSARVLEAYSSGNDSGAIIDIPKDQMGLFIYRSKQIPGRYSNRWKVRVEWDYQADGYKMEELPAQINLYALEMTYIPGGAFEVGDPQGIEGPDNAFFTLGQDSTGTYRIASSAAIPVCNKPGSICYENKFGQARGGDQKGPVPASFPKGYKAFYLMKYKVTQGQYAAMLNTLTDLQSANRSINGSKDYSDRGSIRLIDGKYMASRPNRACHYLGWEDSALFADWAALRPYTELEYEKAARGPLKAVTNEFAWGTTNIYHGDTIYDPNGLAAAFENGDEYIAGNANYRPMDRDYFNRSETVFIGGDGGVGPLRVDIFETRAWEKHQKNFRESAGTGYYGTVGLTGGLFERVVSIGNPRGRAFIGTHGDGQVNYEGFAENTLNDWPSRTGEGLGLRARNFAFDPRKMQMANRGFGQYDGTYREAGMGFRAARTAND